MAKVMICPICGGRNWKWLLTKPNAMCLDCKKEIIPLVTPQEVKNGNTRD